MIQRMLRAARLDAAFYETVEADPAYNREAVWVVVITSLLSGIGSAIKYGGFKPIASDLVSGLVGWVLWAAITLWIGTTITRGPETRSDMGEMLRVLGYSYAPRALAFFVFVPLLGWLAALVAVVWQLVASVVAIRQALDFTTTRALITVILGWIVVVIVSIIFGILFGIGGAVMGG